MKKSGFISVIGRTNAGKSSFLNWIFNEELLLVSHKTNATRKRFELIYTYEENQLIFVDTPGICEKNTSLQSFMDNEIQKALIDCDIILYLIPITDSIHKYEQFLKVIENKKHIVLLTKSDIINHEKIFKQMLLYQKYQNKFSALIPISIKNEKSKKSILDEIVKILPYHDFYYDSDYLSPREMKEFYKEIIREAIFKNTSDEIPYFSDVRIDKVEEFENLEKIYATIITDKASQKAMIIGKDANCIKRIGKNARNKLLNFTNKKVFLDLKVINEKNWHKNEKILKKLGYYL